MVIDFRMLAVSGTLLTAIPEIAVPPPNAQLPNLLPLATTSCPIGVTGAATPYSPAVYHFDGSTEDTLLIVNARPDLNLNFNLGLVGESPFVSGAGFGADVRVRLPRTGEYQLEVYGYDPVLMKALPADFTLKIALRGEKVPQDC